MYPLIVFVCALSLLILSSDTLYATRAQRSSMASIGVNLTFTDNHVVVSNGFVRMIFSNPEGHITSIQYNGMENLLEVINDESSRGYWDLVWSPPGTPGTTGTFERIVGTSCQVIVETEEQVELSFSTTWNSSLEGKHVPLKIDKRFVLLRGSSGFYSYAIYEHLEGWPGFNLAETRIVFKLRNDKFHYMAMSDYRRRYMPSPNDRSPNRGKPLAYPEAVLLVNPVEPEFKGEVDDKYQYSCETEDLKIHGWISTDPPVGFWQITPSNEFRTGGPTKQDLTSHVGPTNLAMFVSTHYAGSDLVIKFKNREKWKKVFGPVFMYLSSTGEEPLTLWNDAKNQMLEEVGKWPYSFPASSDFHKAHERGRISGRLFVYDRFITDEKTPATSASIGLAPPGDPGSWQRENKGYQFWTKTDVEGRFSIKNVVAGTYNVYAWVHGFIGDFKNDSTITITQGCDIDVGDLVFEPPRDGPTLWEIGVPDRSAAEFYIPDSDRMYTNMFLANDHNRKRYDIMYEKTTWTIKFKLHDVNKNGTYKLRLALASAQLSDLQVRANDPNTDSPLFSTGTIGGDNAVARHGIHGLYWLFNVDIPGKFLNLDGENAIYLTKINEGIIFPGGIMYDYIRLEGPPPCCS
ncbi:rhamnogalacturonate lyase B isoform X2 [Helianthus annuus]|uniref:rhamnogalacturonate lyase B isoform X2 n=1 Tax=Helianthus annuus TaxID=4232 RepID=UPI000B8FB41A|nr:rhamnogalacturonate lyase B isoform X2 [Helianthus annuus]